MTITTAYHCNFCGADDTGGDLNAMEYASLGSLRLAEDGPHHLCDNCLASITELGNREEGDKETCFWVQQFNITAATSWRVGCRNFSFNWDGGVGQFKFCPYCGKKFSYVWDGPKDKK